MKRKSTLRRAFLKAKGESSYCSIQALRSITGWTDEQIVSALEANMPRYQISAELPFGKYKDKVRWRGRNIALIRVSPNSPHSVVDGIEYV